MVEIKFNLGPYKISLDYDGADVDTGNGIAVIRSNGHPDINMFISKVQRDINRDDLYRDTIINDTYIGIIARLRSTETMAPICDINPKIMIDGHLGFSVFFSGEEGGLDALRVGYWLEDDDAISVFAGFPSESNFQNDMIDILANHVKVRRS